MSKIAQEPISKFLQVCQVKNRLQIANSVSQDSKYIFQILCLLISTEKYEHDTLNILFRRFRSTESTFNGNFCIISQAFPLSQKRNGLQNFLDKLFRRKESSNNFRYFLPRRSFLSLLVWEKAIEKSFWTFLGLLSI